MRRRGLKRALALVLAVAMCFSMDMPAVAAQNAETSSEQSIEEAIVTEITEDTASEDAANENEQIVVEETEEISSNAVSEDTVSENMEGSNANEVPADFIDTSGPMMQELMAKAEEIAVGSKSSGSKKADIVFVIDNTGSMSDEIAAVKTNLAAFVNYLAEKGLTLRFGIISYKDITCDGMDSTVVFKSGLSASTWYTSAGDTIAALDTIRVGGGGDRPETLVDALGYLVDDETYNWSSTATRCAIVLTDADYKYNSRWGYTEEDAAAMDEVAYDLAERHIVTSVITSTSFYSVYQNLVDITGGILGDISSNFLIVLQEMADNILSHTEDSNIGVYILPGYMGSKLYSKESDEEVWVGMDALVDDVVDFVTSWTEQTFSTKGILCRDENGEGGKVKVDAENDLYGSQETYEKLINYLNENLDKDTYTVKFFPYDWLGDLNDAEAELENSIKANGYDKVILVTHSTGGLLAADYIAKSEANRDKVEKAILVAPPLYGTYTALEPLEEGDTSGLSDLLDKNLPEIFVKAKVATYYVIHKWVRSTVKNTPTTYQLLPSSEYLKLMPQLYADDFDGAKAVTTMDEYYKMLKGSTHNLNENLLDGNSNSHKYFRDTVLHGDIRNVLNQVDTTVIGNSYGYTTPAIAQYSAIFGGITKYKDIVYKMDGDGTVMGVSSLLRPVSGSKTDSIERIDMKDVDKATSGKLDHGGLVSQDAGLEQILKSIKETEEETDTPKTGSSIDWVEDEVYTAADAGSAGMKTEAKLSVLNNQATEFKVYDKNDKLVAESTSANQIGFGTLEGFTFDDLSEEDGNSLYQICLPRQGYKVEIYNTTDAAPAMKCAIATLDRDGYRKETATFEYSAADASSKLVAAYDLTGTVLTEDVPDFKTLDEAAYKQTLSNQNDWAIDDSLLMKELGKTAELKLSGSDAEKIDVKDLVWSSSDEAVVTVSYNQVTAVGYGTATVYAASKDTSGKVEACQVTVGLEPTAVSIEDFTLVKGHRIRPVATFEPEGANLTDMTYTSDDSQIVKVVNGSTLCAVGEGSVRVVGKTENGLEAEFFVKVTSSDTLYVDDVSIDPAVAVLSKDQETKVTARIIPETALNKEVVWTVEDDSIATLSMNADFSCTLTGLQEGVTKLSALSKDGSYSDESTIVVGSILDTTQNNRMIMLKESQKQIVLGNKDTYYPIVKASSTDTSVVNVSNTGMITTVGTGRAVLILEGKLHGETINSSVQIEVVSKLDDVVKDVKAAKEYASSNIYLKKSGSLEVDINLKDEAFEAVTGAVDSVAMSISEARFKDSKVNKLFALKPSSDNILAIEPVMELDSKSVEALADTYTSAIVVTINGKEYETSNTVTILPDKTKPVITAKPVTLNTYYNDAKADIVFTSNAGNVTTVSLNKAVKTPIPEGLTLDEANQTIQYNGKSISAGNNVFLLAGTDETRAMTEVNLNVKAKLSKPAFKLSSAQVKMYEQISDSKGLTLTLSPKTAKKLLSDYEVSNLVVSDPEKLTDAEKRKYTINSEYAITKFDAESGEFLVKAKSSDGKAKAGKLLLEVKMYGTDTVVKLPLQISIVKTGNATIKLKRSSVTMNPNYLSAVCNVGYTVVPADYNTKDLVIEAKTKTGAGAGSYVSGNLIAGKMQVRLKSGAKNKSTYILRLYDGVIDKSVKVNVKTSKHSASAAVSGRIDLTKPASAITIKTNVSGVATDKAVIRLVPTVKRIMGSGRSSYYSDVTSAFNVVPLGNGIYKLTVNTDSYGYKNGYLNNGYKYVVNGKVYVGDNLVGSIYKSDKKSKRVSVVCPTKKLTLNYETLELKANNVELPVALLAEIAGMDPATVNWQISGTATDFVTINELDDGKYALTLKELSTKKSQSGKLTITATIPGTKKVAAKKDLAVIYNMP